MRRDEDRLLVGLDDDETAAGVLAVARRLGAALGAQMEVVHVGTELPEALAELARRSGVDLDHEPGDPIDVLRRRLAEPSVRMAVLGCRGADCPRPAGHVALDLIRHASKPVVVVPLGTAVRGDPLRDVLLPLDGSREAAAAVGPTVELLAGHGLRVSVAHVFEGQRVPSFLDQPHHALHAWGEEFLARHATRSLELVLRTGRPGEQLLDVVAAVAPDLIVLGWSQDLGEGRAQTIREMLASSPVPLLLVPADGAVASAADPRLSVGGWTDW